MAERFQKIYISIHEFISSWDKEVYELSNLDYFTYLLINNLAYQIEHEFLGKINHAPHLRLEPDEIGTLAFNIGDGFESFLQDNCFGNCSLSCPTHLNDKPAQDEVPFSAGQHYLFQIIGGNDWNKKQYLITDILNYVVLDSLFDFYNYDIGLDIDETDLGLLHFADFIADIIAKLVEQKGQPYLKAPTETASELFENLLAEGSEQWDESIIDAFDDEEEGAESWKLDQENIQVVIAEYLSDLDKTKNYEQTARYLDYFSRYDEDYAGIVEIDQITEEDLREFFTFWLIRELTLESGNSVSQIHKAYANFFAWLAFTKDVEIKDIFDDIMKKELENIEKSLNLISKFYEKNSYVEQFLDHNDEEQFYARGFYKIEKISTNGLLKLTDIHLRKTFVNVQIENSIRDLLKNDFIFQASLKPTSYGWRIANLEYVYPKSAHPFLH